MPCRHIRRGRGACCLIFSHTRDVSVATRRDSPTLKAACSLQGLGAFVFHVKCRRFVALDSHCNGGHRSVRFFLFLRSNTRTSCSRSSITFVPRVTSSSTNDDAVSAPKPPQLGYDPSEDLFGLEANSKPRFVNL
ncbi:hypothetical protein DVH24_040740 [Malus domestica]|uniref:Uncharacterized protein n=1 Tax=Malus domestica TaxID=3750 RepID=A0A498IEG6_MALDO|nr:hypothetical protein DVH24_040740 [Malus domestica]